VEADSPQPLAGSTKSKVENSKWGKRGREVEGARELKAEGRVAVGTEPSAPAKHTGPIKRAGLKAW
jgi:hypothetical protein